MKQAARMSALYGGVLVLVGACVIDWDPLDPALRVEETAPDPVCTPGDERPCYDGPAGTEDVGTCVGGVATCLEDGSAFGACDGAVVPVEEDCATPEDDNCNGRANEVEAGCPCTPGLLYSCYDGPEETRDAGICIGGQALCGDDATLGICVGQVLPILEECHTAADDDCDGVVNPACPTASARFTTTGNDAIVWGLAISSDDDLAVGGWLEYEGSIDFGGGAITNAALLPGLDDGFVVKLAPDFSHEWTWHLTSAGGNDEDQVLGVDFDGAGNVYVTGHFSGTVDFGPVVGDVLAVAEDAIFVARLSSATGVPNWVIQLGEAGTSGEGRGITTDASGVSVVTGWFSGTVTLDGTPYSSSSSDGFILALDANGQHLWGTDFGTSGADRGYAVTRDSGGNVLVAGEFDTSVDFGGDPIDGGDGQDGFIAKLSSSGTQQWVVGVGNEGDQSVRGLAVDGADNVVGYGEYDGILEIDTVSRASAGALDILAVKLSPTGAVAWANGWGGLDDQSCGGVAVTSRSDIWLGVSHEHVASYGGLPVFSAGNDDWVMVKLDGDANHIRTHRYGRAGDQDPRALAVDSTGALVVAGDCTGVVDFGVGDLGGGDTEDVCIVKQPQ